MRLTLVARHETITSSQVLGSNQTAEVSLAMIMRERYCYRSTVKVYSVKNRVQGMRFFSCFILFVSFFFCGLGVGRASWECISCELALDVNFFANQYAKSLKCLACVVASPTSGVVGTLNHLLPPYSSTRSRGRPDGRYARMEGCSH